MSWLFRIFSGEEDEPVSKGKRLMKLIVTVNCKCRFTVKEIANEFSVSTRTTGDSTNWNIYPRRFVILLGKQATVWQPKELRTGIRRLLSEMMAQYADEVIEGAHPINNANQIVLFKVLKPLLKAEKA